jgi:hypothetical protein
MDIQKSFDESLLNSVLPDTAIDIADSSIDTLLSNELLKQVPIVKTFIGFVQAGINIHDKLFLKKILSFLSNIEEINPKKRRKMISSIDNSEKYRLKVGEKLLYVIDSCDDSEGAERIAKLFQAVLSKEITYEMYLEAAGIVARISNRELQLFLNSYNVLSMEESANELTHTGLVYTETEEVEVDLEKIEQSDWDDPAEHYVANVSGGEITIRPTTAGDTLYKVFGSGRNSIVWQQN